MNWGNLLRADIVSNTPSLTSLSLSVYTVTMEMATALARNSTITELRLLDCSIPDEVVPTLLGKPNLQSLYVLNNFHSRSPNYLRGLRHATSLRTIELSASMGEARTAIGRELIECLIRCHTLDTLSIPSFSVGAEGVQQLTLHMPVKELKLCGEDLGATGLMHVRNNSTLRALSLNSGTVGGVEGMKYLGDNASICSLVLLNVKDLDTQGVMELMRRNTTLTTLQLSNNSLMLDQSACRAMAAHPSLRTVLLDISDCGPVLQALCNRSPPELTKLVINARSFSALDASETPSRPTAGIEDSPFHMLTSLRVAELSLSLNVGMPLQAANALLQNPSLTSLTLRCDRDTLGPIAKCKPRRLSCIPGGYHYGFNGLAFGNPSRDRSYVALLIFVAMARIRAWARGTAGGSLLMQTPMEVFTHILSSVDIFEIGLPRWKLAAIVRFLFQNRIEAERRLSNCYSMQLVLRVGVSCVDFIDVSWAVPAYQLEANRRMQRESEAQRREEIRRAKIPPPRKR